MKLLFDIAENINVSTSVLENNDTQQVLILISSFESVERLYADGKDSLVYVPSIFLDLDEKKNLSPSWKYLTVLNPGQTTVIDNLIDNSLIYLEYLPSEHSCQQVVWRICVEYKYALVYSENFLPDLKRKVFFLFDSSVSCLAISRWIAENDDVINILCTDKMIKYMPAYSVIIEENMNALNQISTLCMNSLIANESSVIFCNVKQFLYLMPYLRKYQLNTINAKKIYILGGEHLRRMMEITDTENSALINSYYLNHKDLVIPPGFYNQGFLSEQILLTKCVEKIISLYSRYGGVVIFVDQTEELLKKLNDTEVLEQYTTFDEENVLQPKYTKTTNSYVEVYKNEVTLEDKLRLIFSRKDAKCIIFRYVDVMSSTLTYNWFEKTYHILLYEKLGYPDNIDGVVLQPWDGIKIPNITTFDAYKSRNPISKIFENSPLLVSVDSYIDDSKLDNFKKNVEMLSLGQLDNQNLIKQMDLCLSSSKSPVINKETHQKKNQNKFFLEYINNDKIIIRKKADYVAPKWDDGGNFVKLRLNFLNLSEIPLSSDE